MRKFGSLFLAAVLGSVCTVASYQWLEGEKENVKVEHIANIPTSKVAYTVDEDGKAVPLDFTVAAEKVMPAVVHIRSTQEGTSRKSNGREEYQFDPFRDFFGPRFQQQGPSQSTGSGVIINESGYIVTNNHVVEGADVVEVSLTDNRTFKAEVIGTDPDTDIALIKINQKGLPYLSFVDSDKTKVGEWVLAIGNPFNLNSTVTAGIISAKGRSINILSRNSNNGQGSTAIESFIQTDAAINPGNSGGALVDLQGGLVGINTAIASPTGSYSGYGFAVPSDIVSKVVEDLLKFGTVQRGWLGVSIASVNSDLVKEYDLSVNEGAYISAFADQSSAKEAGLKEGDVVIKIDETPIRSNTALIEYIGRRRPGDKVNVTVNRKGKEMTIPVVLKNKEGKTDAVKPEEREGFATLGIELEDIDAKVLKKLDINSGVRVKDVGNGKLAKYTEMREGFIITKVNDTPVKSVKEFNEILKKKKPGELVILSGTYEDFPREYNYALRM
ncbi:Do family serine endopeptidase [Chryseosolibacter indicus]|uniref:Do family serine endopeptidase n=1 Tax=Chryseosolibacter indicus TaxID=2782351 RepID=A0ABS5VNM4_9BACT|nr:Do family serine endopeptidase [Chryseosolibacter indicus]MBT1703038.1 Do family serine endopeptidase [Chryseosolibacter indicus]